MAVLAYSRVGSGKPLVILHGLGGSKRSIQKVLAPYFQDSYEVICLDLLGHGDSPTIDLPNIPKLISDIANMVIESLDEMGIQEFSLCGFSFGGTVAIDVAARYPERVEKLVLWEAPYWGNEFPNFYRVPFFVTQRISQTVHHPSLSWWVIHHVPKLLGITKKLVRFCYKSLIAHKIIHEKPHIIASHTAEDNVQNKELRLLLQRERMRTDRASWAACVAALMQHDARNAIKQITCPTFLIGGRKAQANSNKIRPRPLDSTAKIFQLLKQGNASFVYSPVIVEGAGHDGIYTHTGVIAFHIRKFLLHNYSKN